MILEVEGRTFHHRGSESDTVVIRELWGNEDDYKVRGLDPTPKIVVDVGGNIGLFSALIAHLYPEAKTYVYEPELDNYAYLLKNIEQFGESIIPHRSAIYLDDSGVNLTPNHGLTEVTGTGDYAPSITLDTALEPFDQVDILKCDTEGSEFEIFGAASIDTMSKIKLLTMEFHDYYGANRREFLISKLAETHDMQWINHAIYVGWRK